METTFESNDEQNCDILLTNPASKMLQRFYAENTIGPCKAKGLSTKLVQLKEKMFRLSQVLLSNHHNTRTNDTISQKCVFVRWLKKKKLLLIILIAFRISCVYDEQEKTSLFTLSSQTFRLMSLLKEENDTVLYALIL